MKKHLVVAIDGPAGSGKSTVARRLAAAIGLERLDTGAMYRAVAWAAIDSGVPLDDGAALGELARALRIDVTDGAVVVGGTDVTAAVRTPEVNHAVSLVAAVPAVRAELAARQRRWVEERGGGVVEGRDIGSVVFPEASVKVYLDASPGERARRRGDEGAEAVARRDRLDASRALAPLSVPEGAHVIDTTRLSVDAVVEEVLAWI
ncbi:MAG: (d)CMP kinase [Actinomycetota bacterium]|jgi:cytidylate kinase|nr:(d)CMP kinase [Actinomycetota bacterium]